jgi:hypothetical protein
MDEVVELIVVIPTSPRSSKTGSGCKSYHNFCVDVYFHADISAQTWVGYPPPRISCLLLQVGVWALQASYILRVGFFLGQ